MNGENLIGKNIIFTFNEYEKEYMTYGKTYLVIDHDIYKNPKTGEIMKELLMIMDDGGNHDWYSLTYFDDPNELRKLKLNRLTEDE